MLRICALGCALWAGPALAQLPTNHDAAPARMREFVRRVLRSRPAQRGTPVSTTPHPAVVRVIVPEKSSAALGSGTLVVRTATSGYVITNWHVIRDGKHGALVLFPDGQQAQGKIVKADPDWDLAVVEIPRPEIEPLAIDDRRPQPGERLWIAGYGGGDFLLQSGVCSQYLAPNPNWPHELVEIGAAARQGDSGGPIMNARGDLAGVLFGEGDGFTTGSFGGRVLAFLETVSVRTEVGSQTLGKLAHRERSTDNVGKEIALAKTSAPIEDAAGRYWQASPDHAPKTSIVAAPVAAESSSPMSVGIDLEALRAAPLVDKVAAQAKSSEFEEALALRERLIAEKEARRTPAVAARPPVEALPQASISVVPTTPLETSALTWTDLAGPTLWDQTKTVGWTLFGGFVFLKICGMLTRQSPAQPKPVNLISDDDLTDIDDDEDDEDEDDDDDE
ncbi:MAG: trypsin-like peptidase domain-containing protein [Pirellulales bacterium]